MTTIRVTTRNNSDTRKFHVLDDVRSAKCRHNGGNLMIVELDSADVGEAVALLEASHAVARYQIV
jgi:hypothetical protein